MPADWEIPLADVTFTGEEIAAVQDCYRAGWLTMGPRTQAFEAALAERLGAEHVVAVSSGTAALHLALVAAGVGPGDEVVLPAMTFVAAAHAVRACGATPVFCDIAGDADLNLDPADAVAKIGPRTAAVLATHWFGYPCDVAALESAGVPIVEDAAQAIDACLADGRRAGTAGVAGCLSFFSKKQLCVGEGGAVLTADPAVAARVRSLRSHAMTSVTWDRHRGHAESYDIVDIGFNFRLDEPRAAIGLSRLPGLAAEIEGRRRLAHLYRERLAGLEGVSVPWADDDMARSTHFAAGVVFGDVGLRERAQASCTREGVQTTRYPAVTQFTEYATQRGTCPRAESVAERHLALPMSASYGEPEADRIAAAIARAL